jgi:hypothetical protein
VIQVDAQAALLALSSSGQEVLLTRDLAENEARAYKQRELCPLPFTLASMPKLAMGASSAEQRRHILQELLGIDASSLDDLHAGWIP